VLYPKLYREHSKTASIGMLIAVAILSATALAKQAPALRITAPAPDVIVSGSTRIEVAIEPASELANVKTVTFSVNGRLACMLERPPFTTCSFEPGDVVRGHHIRVVATLKDGRRLVDNRHTKEIGYAEKIRTSAVLVPLIVTNGGTFVKGLKQQDFEIFEDGVRQPIDSMVTDDAPLDLVLAIDVSGSMERALVDVKPAVKQLLSRLRPGDAATLVGFNDTMFVAAEREKDRRTREEAVDLLSSWGGTALYDATIRTLELVSRETGRKGIVIFSDGDDRNSVTRRETAMARVQASDAMLYTIGFGGGATVPQLRASLEAYARSTGGKPFFPKHTGELDAVFDEIVSELANQYVLSYSPLNPKQDGKWRKIRVRVRKGNYDIRAREGYVAGTPQQAER
jgi:Ca-activated chloride channel family protein